MFPLCCYDVRQYCSISLIFLAQFQLTIALGRIISACQRCSEKFQILPSKHPGRRVSWIKFQVFFQLLHSTRSSGNIYVQNEPTPLFLLMILTIFIIDFDWNIRNQVKAKTIRCKLKILTCLKIRFCLLHFFQGCKYQTLLW